jgi:exodeoxyribonuclease VII large subunit
MNTSNTSLSPTQQTNDQRQILSVTQLNRLAKSTLDQLPLLWIEGEVSNFAKPSSGHWYFTLKDKTAQVRCAMFRNRNQGVRFQVNQGTQVLVRAKISLYEGRGDYQIIVEHMEEAGLGRLHREFERLKQKLSDQGLFDSQHKQPVPDWPLHIGVITSPTGAAVKDVCSVLKRRCPALAVTVIPTAVQGTQAAEEIIQALYIAENSGLFDVILITRGGGSLEDLWCFNDEQLARAIYDCPIPIVSAVGHEIDFTISDFVADIRAPTPSAAAEILSPDVREYNDKLNAQITKLTKIIQHSIESKKMEVARLRAQVKHPGQRLQNQSQTLDSLELRMHRVIKNLLSKHKQSVAHRNQRLATNSPERSIQQQTQWIIAADKRFTRQINQLLNTQKSLLASAGKQLNSVSPLNVLNRGYALVSNEESEVVSESSQVEINDTVNIRLSKGQLKCTVTHKD